VTRMSQPCSSIFLINIMTSYIILWLDLNVRFCILARKRVATGKCIGKMGSAYGHGGIHSIR
jgi:hypothetical protein